MMPEFKVLIPTWDDEPYAIEADTPMAAAISAVAKGEAEDRSYEIANGKESIDTYVYHRKAAAPRLRFEVEGVPTPNYAARLVES